MPSQQQPTRNKGPVQEELLSMLADERPVVADLFRRVIKGYLGKPSDGTSKERQAKLQKIILDAVENKNPNGMDDKGE